MNLYITKSEPPMSRRRYCADGIEHCLSEGAVMIAFALHLLDRGAISVSIHPDGEHGKRYDLKGTLLNAGFRHIRLEGSTTYAGHYERKNQTVSIKLKPGLGDVVTELNGRKVVAECKGGVINSNHAGQVSRLRRGLCEAVGLLLVRPPHERHIAVVPHTAATAEIARRMMPRAASVGIEVALIDEAGGVRFVQTVA